MTGNMSGTNLKNKALNNKTGALNPYEKRNENKAYLFILTDVLKLSSIFLKSQ